jgi:hypothetical protein
MTEVAGPPVPPVRFSSLALGENEAIDEGCGSGLVIGPSMTAVFEVLLRKPTNKRARFQTDTNHWRISGRRREQEYVSGMVRPQARKNIVDRQVTISWSRSVGRCQPDSSKDEPKAYAIRPALTKSVHVIPHVSCRFGFRLDPRAGSGDRCSWHQSPWALLAELRKTAPNHLGSRCSGIGVSKSSRCRPWWDRPGRISALARNCASHKNSLESLRKLRIPWFSEKLS